MTARIAHATRIALWVSCALLLAACGPAKPKLEPPAVRIVRLDLEQPGVAEAQDFRLTVRVRNSTDAVLPAHRLMVDLSLGDAPPMHFERQLEQEIPPQGREVVVFSGRLSTAEAQSLAALTTGERGQLPYVLEGVALPPDDELEFRYEGWLSPTPGIPGSFR